MKYENILKNHRCDISVSDKASIRCIHLGFKFDNRNSKAIDLGYGWKLSKINIKQNEFKPKFPWDANIRYCPYCGVKLC